MKKILRESLGATAAGFLNGMLGTGGGVALWFALRSEKDRRRAYATSSVGVLLLCLQSLFLYRESHVFHAVTPFFLFFAVLGGAIGAFLLGKIKRTLLRRIFSSLLIVSGGYLLIKELYYAFLS